jgi:hypothetical protein
MSIVLDGTTGINTSAGVEHAGAYTGTYSDGTVVDYATGLGRISVGSGDALAFYNGGVATTELMRLNSSGNLGIGVTPSAWGSDRKALQLGNGASINGSISVPSFGEFASNFYNDGTNDLYITTNAAAKYRQYSGGHIFSSAGSGTANTTISFSQVLQVSKGVTLALEGATQTAGTGIAFPATQSASSDANTLDDYEEGTWTPSIGGTATYTDRSGYYTKVGNLVTVALKIQINTIGTGGLYTITSLPFTSRSTAVPVGSVGYFTGITTNVYSLNCYIDPNTTNLSFVGQNSFTNSNAVPINVFQNNALIYATATYFV